MQSCVFKQFIARPLIISHSCLYFHMCSFSTFCGQESFVHMTILDPVIYIQNNSCWIVFIFEGMPASQREHDRDLLTGTSFPGRQNPVGCRLGQAGPGSSAGAWPQRAASGPPWTWAETGDSVVWAWGHKTAPEPGKVLALLSTERFPLYCVHHTTSRVSPCLQGRHPQAGWRWEEATKAVGIEPSTCEERLWGMLKWFFFHSYAKTDKKDIIKNNLATILHSLSWTFKHTDTEGN